MATEPQIIAIVRTAQRRRLKVLDFQTIRKHTLGTAAISTLEPGVFSDEIIKPIRYSVGRQCRIHLGRANKLFEYVLPKSDLQRTQQQVWLREVRMMSLTSASGLRLLRWGIQLREYTQGAALG
jgi:hypothetical protein